jgi:hypothetical protein
VTGDNCSVASVTSNAPALFPIGTNAITWRATDPSGNSSTCSQLVIVRLTRAAPLMVRLLLDDNIGLSVNAICDLPFRIEASTDLLDWRTLTNFPSPAGRVEYSDLAATNFPRRFYRAVWVP